MKSSIVNILIVAVLIVLTDAIFYRAGKESSDHWWANHIITVSEYNGHDVSYELVGVQRCVGMDYVKNGEVYIYRIVLDGGKCIPNSGWAH